MYVPKKMFLTKGKGIDKEKLTSFEMALREAHIAHLNLVKVSSILPPLCEIVPIKHIIHAEYNALKAGAITHVVMAQCETNEPNRLIAASIGVARPDSPDHHGYLSEYHGFGKKATCAGEYAEDLAATMLATTLGVEFDPYKDYDERKEIYRMSGKIIKSSSITQTAEGNKDGLWTTVVAAAVLLP